MVIQINADVSEKSHVNMYCEDKHENQYESTYLKESASTIICYIRIHELHFHSIACQYIIAWLYYAADYKVNLDQNGHHSEFI